MLRVPSATRAKTQVNEDLLVFFKASTSVSADAERATA
jgi:hypothetical protein